MVETGKYYRTDDILCDWFAIFIPINIINAKYVQATFLSSKPMFTMNSDLSIYSIEHNKLKPYRNYREATDFEIHWLNECIKLGKYITEDKAKLTYKQEINILLW